MKQIFKAGYGLIELAAYMVFGILLGKGYPFDACVAFLVSVWIVQIAVNWTFQKTKEHQ